MKLIEKNFNSVFVISLNETGLFMFKCLHVTLSTKKKNNDKTNFRTITNVQQNNFLPCKQNLKG